MMAASQFASLKSCDHLSASPFAGSPEAGPVPAVGVASLGKEMLRMEVELPPWPEPRRGWGRDAEAQPR